MIVASVERVLDATTAV